MPEAPSTAATVDSISRGVTEERKNDRDQKRLPNPLAWTAQKISRIRPLSVESLPRLEGSLKTALISLPALDQSLVHHDVSYIPPGTRGSSDYERRLTIYPHPHDELLCKPYQNALEDATRGRYGAKMVCVNELGFPGNGAGPCPSAFAFSRKLAQDQKCLLIAGSGHDPRSKYNTGYVFYPSQDRTAALGDYKAYHKQVSAGALDPPELVSVAGRRETLLIHAFGLGIAVLVCLDIGDYSALTPVVQSDALVDMLVIPTYSRRKDTLGDCAKLISCALPGIVALVDYDTGGGYGSSVYRFGKEERIAQTSRPLQSGGSILFYTFSPTQFKRDKLGRQSQVSVDLNWLFGKSPRVR